MNSHKNANPNFCPVNSIDYLVLDNERLFLDKYPTPDETPDPINIDTKKIHQVKLPPLHLIGAVFAFTKLSNTGKSGNYINEHLQIFIIMLDRSY